MAENAAASPASGRIAGSSQAVLVVDDDGALIEASLGACRLLGVARSDIVGRRIESLFEPESSERFAAAWPALRSGGSAGSGPFALEAPASVVEVGLMVTARILPSRHLVAFEPAGGSERQGAGPRVGLRAVREPSPANARSSRCSPRGRPTARSPSGCELSPGDRPDPRPQRQGKARGPDQGAGRGDGPPARADRRVLSSGRRARRAPRSCFGERLRSVRRAD